MEECCLSCRRDAVLFLLDREFVAIWNFRKKVGHDTFEQNVFDSTSMLDLEYCFSTGNAYHVK